MVLSLGPDLMCCLPGPHWIWFQQLPRKYRKATFERCQVMAIVVAGYSIEGNVLGSPLNFSKAYVGPEIRYRTQLQIESEL